MSPLIFNPIEHFVFSKSVFLKSFVLFPGFAFFYLVAFDRKTVVDK